jgi:nucleoside-diphosphate-sugar epimerase
MRRVLMTGSAGFVGSHVADHRLAAGYRLEGRPGLACRGLVA